MARTDGNLHGNAPDKSAVALLLIDVINALDFPEGPELLEEALPMARRIAALKSRARQAGVPAVYVNDNFGRWRSDFRSQVDHCLQPDSLGRPIVELLRPDEDDYFVLKPAHSGFFSTSLGLLLDHFQAHTLIVTGVAANICVLFTANDAYMRGYHVIVPTDCVASNTADDTRAALSQMQTALKADVCPADRLDFEQLLTADCSAGRHRVLSHSGAAL